MQNQDIVVNDIYFSDMRNTFICDECGIEGGWAEKAGETWFPYHYFLMLFLTATAFHKIFIFSTKLLSGDISQGKILILHTVVNYSISWVHLLMNMPNL